MNEQVIYGILMMISAPIIIYGIILLMKKIKKPKGTYYIKGKK